VFINAAHLLTHYSLLILPTAVLVMAQPGGAFGDDYGPIVTSATGMFVLYGAGSLPQGWLAARLGRKVLMGAFFIGTGVSLVAAAFVSTTASARHCARLGWPLRCDLSPGWDRDAR
jgi:MFS family permease